MFNAILVYLSLFSVNGLLANAYEVRNFKVLKDFSLKSKTYNNGAVFDGLLPKFVYTTCTVSQIRTTFSSGGEVFYPSDEAIEKDRVISITASSGGDFSLSAIDRYDAIFADIHCDQETIDGLLYNLGLITSEVNFVSSGLNFKGYSYLMRQVIYLDRRYPDVLDVYSSIPSEFFYSKNLTDSQLDKIIKEESKTGFLDPEFAASWFRRRMINSLMESLNTGSRESWKRFEESERIERKLVNYLTVHKKVAEYVDVYATEIISKLDLTIIQ